MKKYVFLIALFFFLTILLSGCSMLPDDEDIIKGSVLENEIFGDELFNDGLDGNELEKQKISDDYEIVEDEESVEDDEEGDVEMQFEVVE